MDTSATMRGKHSLAPASARVFGLIRHELELVELEFERQASSNIQVIDYLGEYLRASGGKRVRPALLILANRTVGGAGSTENVIRMATVMEMLHTATLVHDDIIDNADLRRNRPSVNSHFGNNTAVLMGDWLYMSAFETTVQERSLDIIDILTRVTRKMTEGELIQLTRVGKLDISEDDYFDILKRKTAFLFAACCEVGAILGEAKQVEKEALRDFGMHLGIAFQLSDDILDLTSRTENLGKAAGSDLLEGKLTLPLIYLLKKNPSLRPSLQKIMLEGRYGAVSRAALQEMLDDHGILEDIRSRTNHYVEAARKSLDVLPGSEYRSCLDDVLSFVTERNF
jgi:octaprenyl-diphosphate synthase